MLWASSRSPHASPADSTRSRGLRRQLTVSQPGALFYDNLFAADPSLRKLFHGSIAQQGERPMSMIGSALNLLDRPATLLPVLRQLGARHAGYAALPRWAVDR